MRVVKLIEGDLKTRHTAMRSYLEEFFASSLPTAENSYRVAYELPSGRPIVIRGAKEYAVSLSLSHVGSLTAMVVDDEVAVGIDLVRSDDSGGLEDWSVGDRTSILPSSFKAAYCWAAREAAYKALAIDRPFRPDSFRISFFDLVSFDWNFHENDLKTSGKGSCELVGGVVCAVASGRPLRQGVGL